MANTSQKIRKNSFFNLHFTSTISISLVLFMVGLITFLVLGINIFSNKAKENLALAIVLNNEIGQNDLTRLQQYLRMAPFTNKQVYISREEALKEHIRTMGEDPTEFLQYNPLHASIELHLKAQYTNQDSITWIQKKIKAFNGVDNIVYQKNMLNLLTQNVKRVSFILGFITLILLLISIALINNTIRISIYSKRFLINTMRLVGAKPSFIRRPFIRSSITSGLVAGTFATLLLVGMLYYLQTQIGGDFHLFEIEIIIPVMCVIFGVGLIISIFATMFSVNHYIKMKTDKLFYI